MKREWHTTVGAGIFLGLACALYWFLSYEDSGTVMLLFGAAAYLMLGGFIYLQWRRRARLPRPEDKEDGTYEETAGEPIAFFPTASIWPAGIGLAATFIAIALIWGTWYWVPALALLFGSIIGFAVEAEAPDDVPADLEQAAHRQDSTIEPKQIAH
ncbi:MAG TPA: cytochrome c oxidase subunit 4 [Acidimicrobiales bacterium]|nr:cytochrome c oxidase subunit 4 [Acidimicrobiales bacterium]